jgi:AraC-like DNA-binding protein
MLFLQRRPRPPLDRAIQALWVCRHDPRPRAYERVLPNGGPQLIINLLEDQTRVYQPGPHGLVCRVSPGSILSGLATRAQVIDTDEQAFVAGVSFVPGGTLPFTTVPAHELRDADVPLDALWGVAAERRLRQQLIDAASAAQALDVLEAALCAVWRDRTRHDAVAYALSEFQARPALARVDAVTTAIGLSRRRFIERFSRDVGVTPKRYCRLLRFQGAVAAVHRGQRPDWAQVALDAGYFDQAHFIHEFRAFAGVTPTV